MQLVRGLDNYQKEGRLQLALGNFDGVHCGHQVLVKQAIIKARKNNEKSGVLIFEPHPLKVLAPAMAPQMLVNTSRKLELFAALGLDEVIIAEFNLEVAKWSPQYFVEDILLGKLGIGGAYVGFNYTFGHKGSGNAEMLAGYGKQKDFLVEIIPPVKIKDTIVSSTVIRSYMEAGDVDSARQLLGYTPSLTGPVIEGEKRGRSIGFPTANIEPPADMLVPMTGVYAAMVKLQGSLYPAVLNIGKKPTFHKEYPLTIEAHLINYQGDFYGQEVEVLLVKRLRSEMKFESVTKLTAQINQDTQAAIQALKSWQPSDLEQTWLG
ncbi:MAG: bifunctional riboflavin kinase/FAD synthetase [Methylocystaceae bacterium]